MWKRVAIGVTGLGICWLSGVKYVRETTPPQRLDLDLYEEDAKIVVFKRKFFFDTVVYDDYKSLYKIENNIDPSIIEMINPMNYTVSSIKKRVFVNGKEIRPSKD